MMAKNIFERLSKGRPRNAQNVMSARDQQIENAQKLLDWLPSWSKPTISARDICIWGPYPTKKRENAGKAAAILAKNGWLVPQPTHRRDRHVWKIVRRPTLYPDCRNVEG
jgi:hypothetical protein